MHRRSMVAGASPVHESSVMINDTTLHVLQQGRGAPVLFVHGFPDTARTWMRQMAAVAAAGYHAIAVDMRGYGHSSAPADAGQYTPLHLVGDLTGLLDALNLERATVVGHDWGAHVAHHAALLRPDRFPLPSSGSASPTARATTPAPRTRFAPWARPTSTSSNNRSPKPIGSGRTRVAASRARCTGRPGRRRPHSAGARSTRSAQSSVRPPPPCPVGSTRATWHTASPSSPAPAGFHGALNYHRAMQQSFELTAPWKGAAIEVPSFYAFGAIDGLVELGRPTLDTLRPAQPDLLGVLEIPGVGHWPQHEAPEVLNEALLSFLGRTCS